MSILLVTATATGGAVETVQFDLPNLPLSLCGVQLTVDFLGPPAGSITDTGATLRFTTDARFGSRAGSVAGGEATVALGAKPRQSLVESGQTSPEKVLRFSGVELETVARVVRL
jgi:hypothetical protein